MAIVSTPLKKLNRRFRGMGNTTDVLSFLNSRGGRLFRPRRPKKAPDPF